MDQKTYDLIYSLGEDCGCALYMERNGLRSYSGPFDWLTHATLQTKFNLILNDFKGFLDKESIKPLDQENHSSNLNFDLYHDINLDFHFYHDFIKDINFNKNFKSVKNKYNRRIKRFYKKINKADKVLLIWFSRYSIYDSAMEKEFCEKIMEKFDKKIDFLFIEKDGSKKLGELEKIEISPNIIKYILDTEALNGTNNETLGNFIAVNKIFQEYKLSQQKYSPITIKFKVFIIKIMCMFAPSKILRKKLRDSLFDIADI